MKNQCLALVLFVALTTFLLDHVESVEYHSDALKAAAEVGDKDSVGLGTRPDRLLLVTAS